MELGKWERERERVQAEWGIAQSKEVQVPDTEVRDVDIMSNSRITVCIPVVMCVVCPSCLSKYER